MGDNDSVIELVVVEIIEEVVQLVVSTVVVDCGRHYGLIIQVVVVVVEIEEKVVQVVVKAVVVDFVRHNGVIGEQLHEAGNKSLSGQWGKKKKANWRIMWLIPYMWVNIPIPYMSVNIHQYNACVLRE